MKKCFFLLTLGLAASAAGLGSAERPANLTALFAPSDEYDYSIPTPATYELPKVKPATDGTVLGTDGAPERLFELMKGRVVVLSFIYTRCTDPRACLRATGVLRQLQEMSRHDPAVREKLLLLTLSFDPAYDTPEVMSRYGRVSLTADNAAEWLFLTTRDKAALDPLLAAYGQRVDKRSKSGSLGPYSHNLRVYLVDPQRQIRNIYSYGLLDPRLVFTDVQTLLLENARQK